MKYLTKTFNQEISTNFFFFIVSIFLVVTLNNAFFHALIKTYPLGNNFFSLGTLALSLIFFNLLLMTVLNLIQMPKTITIIVLFASTLSAYFMDTYNTTLDQTMIKNCFNTDRGEIFDLMTGKLLFFLLIYTILPSLAVYQVKFKKLRYWIAFRNQVATIIVCLLVMLLLMASASKFYASFLREHKELRYKINPAHLIYSVVKFATSQLRTSQRAYQQIGLDAKIPITDQERELVIVVIGETARSDHFSLNGYNKPTNPLLSKEEVISFPNVFSCGTSTAYSLPCMFSNLGSAGVDNNLTRSVDNVLDVLGHTNAINILWRDNNSDSKGVATRVVYQDFKTQYSNSKCDEECRDEGMLDGLQEHIDQVQDKDILIVLHQMGSHGPAYYKRYPKAFNRFTPTCNTNELAECSVETISNTFDNTILYTDYFLAQVIHLLKKNSQKFATTMFYLSDHGESLGENGVYLHSMPNLIAPKAQKHIPMIMWFGEKIKAQIDLAALNKNKAQVYTHDYFFHTLLGFFEIETAVYRPQLDIIAPYYRHPR